MTLQTLLDTAADLGVTIRLDGEALKVAGERQAEAAPLLRPHKTALRANLKLRARLERGMALLRTQETTGKTNQYDLFLSNFETLLSQYEASCNQNLDSPTGDTP